MKVVVIGLGSMGKRRARLLQGLPEAPEVVGVNRNPERRQAAATELGIRAYETLDAALAAEGKLDAAFVCTAPATHGQLVPELIERGLDTFMELNLLSDWYAAALQRAKDKGVKLFVAATPIYRREMKFVTEMVRADEKVNYLLHCGQYLPDWHPWQDYHEFFASKKATNGCREIMAVELPWLQRAFGEIESVQVTSGRSTRLDIDFPDHYLITLRHKNGNMGMYCQDVVSRKGLRRLEVFSEKNHLFWEGTPDSLKRYNVDTKSLEEVRLYDQVEQQSGKYAAMVIENMYVDELKACLDYFRRGTVPPYTFEDDFETLKWVDRIEGIGR